MSENYKYRIIVQQLMPEANHIYVPETEYQTYSQAKLTVIKTARDTDISARFYIQRTDTGEVVGLFFGTKLTKQEFSSEPIPVFH